MQRKNGERQVPNPFSADRYGGFREGIVIHWDGPILWPQRFTPERMAEIRRGMTEFPSRVSTRGGLSP